MNTLALTRRRRLVAILTATAALFAVAGPVAAQEEPIPPVPVGANVYALTFAEYGASGASGVGHLQAPTSAVGPSVAVEVDGLTPSTTYRVRLGGEVGVASSCAMTPDALGVFNGDGEWGSEVTTSATGVLRWGYDPLPAFAGNAAESLNNGHPVVVVTQTDGTIVSCADLSGKIEGPNDRGFPLARVGGSSPVDVNNSGIEVSGQINHLGTLLTYDFTFSGTNLINAGNGLQNHIILLRSVDDCPSTPETAITNAVAAITNQGRSSAAPTSVVGLTEVFPRSYSSATGTLRVQGSTVVPGVDQTEIGEYGLVLLGLESAGTDRPNGEENLSTREITPSACVVLVDSNDEVGPTPPTTIAEAETLEELINATDFRANEDAEILRLYQAFFNREPDLAGAKYWLGVSRNGRRTINIAGDFTIASAEFANTYADAPDNAEFLRRVYDNMLGRQPDAAGFNYWLDRVNGDNANGTNPNLGKLSRGQTVFYVALNQEFINNYPFQPTN